MSNIEADTVKERKKSPPTVNEATKQVSELIKIH